MTALTTIAPTGKLTLESKEPGHRIVPAPWDSRNEHYYEILEDRNAGHIVLSTVGPSEGTPLASVSTLAEAHEEIRIHQYRITFWDRNQKPDDDD